MLNAHTAVPQSADRAKNNFGDEPRKSRQRQNATVDSTARYECIGWVVLTRVEAMTEQRVQRKPENHFTTAARRWLRKCHGLRRLPGYGFIESSFNERNDTPSRRGCHVSGFEQQDHRWFIHLRRGDPPDSLGQYVERGAVRLRCFFVRTQGVRTKTLVMSLNFDVTLLMFDQLRCVICILINCAAAEAASGASGERPCECRARAIYFSIYSPAIWS